MNLVGTKYIAPSLSESVGTSGKPIRVYSGQVVGDGSATAVYLYNGTSASASKILAIDASGADRSSDIFDSAIGIRFASGCYMVTDSHSAAGFVTYEEEF